MRLEGWDHNLIGLASLEEKRHQADHLQAKEQGLNRNQPSQHPDLGLSSSRAVKKN